MMIDRTKTMPIEQVAYPCPICAAHDSQPLYPDTLGGRLPRLVYEYSPEHMRTYRWVRCQACRHAFCSPRPSQLRRLYEDVEDPAYLEFRPNRIATAKNVVQQIRRYRPAGRLLDVGCATGDFLSVARASFEVEGLELSRWAAQIARGQGLPVHECDLQGFAPEQPFDVLTLWGVIEHFEEPARDVRKMAELLRPGGLVCLWTGDAESWIARLLGKKWWYVQGQHLQLFSEYSLQRIFAMAGFEDVWIGRYPYVTTVGSLAKGLNRYPAVGPAAHRALSHPWVAARALTLTLPGELFAIFRKRPS